MSNETIFGRVFLGGSKRIGRLPDKVVSMLDSFIESGEHFLIGDCHGADLALQNCMDLKRLGKPIFTYRSTTDEFKITRRKEAAK